MSDATPDLLSALVRIVAGAPDVHLVVVGDVMLDEFVTGRVERTSPEAPVPILRATGSSTSPGGAANVARQAAALGARVTLVGAVGDDDAGRTLLERCRQSGVDVDEVRVDASGRTVRKQRFVAGRHQLVRVDWEEEVAALPLDHLDGALARAGRADAVIVSDYAKGAIDAAAMACILGHAAAWAAPVLVDPKDADLSVYRGATVLKANRVEMEAATGEAIDPAAPDEIARRATRTLEEHDLDAVVVTLGEDGMVVVDRHHRPLRLVPPRHEVFDVSGAGDTVIAVLALGLALAEPLEVAARLANEAAAAVVRRAGVAVVHAADLASALAGQGTGARLDADALADRVRAWRLQGKRIVFTNGCFDLLHVGHLHLLREAAALGDVLVVAVNSDRSVRELKGPGRPHIAEAERVALLEAIGCVDAVVLFDEADPLALVELVLPDVLVKGSDYHPADIVGAEVVVRHGGEVATIDLLPGRSTTAVVDQIRRHDLSEVDGGR